MNHDQLNVYIKHYIEQDKTKSAIMLTAPWGTGKSYYVNHILKPFLQKAGKQCCIVSLYGLKSIYDVNRSLYFETRMNKIAPATELGNSVAVLGKTVFKGVTSFFGIDMNLTEDDMNKLYTSVDFKNKLIVFEDLERTGIDIIDFLGYVNNLVEQDCLKVLLVANEEEIFEYQTKDGFILKQKEFEMKSLYKDVKHGMTGEDEEFGVWKTDKTKEYLRIKEKSVSDTLLYTGDMNESVQNIILMFDDTQLLPLKKQEVVNEILGIFQVTKDSNLRSFLFACQKTSDIYKYIKHEYEYDFFKTIFFGILLFVLKMRRGEEIGWSETSKISYSLGNSTYPLFRFCYDYILYHTVPDENIHDTYLEFEEAKLYDMSQYVYDEDVSIIISFHTETEERIKQSIMKIENKLKNIKNITFYQYGILANYLICLSQYMDCNITGCLELLIMNLKGKGDKINQHHLFRSSVFIDDKHKKDYWINYKNRMIESLHALEKSLFDFDYNHNNISSFCNKVYEEQGHILSEKSFMKRLNVNMFAEMIFGSSAIEINSLRRMFDHMYGSINIKEFLREDKESLEELVKELNDHSVTDGFDAIQTMQKDFLISNLEEYILNLS